MNKLINKSAISATTKAICQTEKYQPNSSHTFGFTQYESRSFMKPPAKKADLQGDPKSPIKKSATPLCAKET